MSEFRNFELRIRMNLLNGSRHLTWLLTDSSSVSSIRRPPHNGSNSTEVSQAFAVARVWLVISFAQSAPFSYVPDNI